jgi:hypothetical protein
LGGQRGGDHEDRGDSTDDRKPDEHLSLSLGRTTGHGSDFDSGSRPEEVVVAEGRSTELG